MTVDREGKRSTTSVRAVTVGLCLVLGALASVAIWGGVVAERSGQRLTRSGDLVEAYLDLARAAAVQDAAEEDEADSERERGRARFSAAADEIRVSLQVLDRLGDPADVALSARIKRAEARYASKFYRYFRALDLGDAELAETAEEDADPAAEVLQNLVTTGGPKQASNSLTEVDRLRRSQGKILRFTVVSVVIGIGVVIALWLVLRSLRRRIEDATEEELERLERATLTDSLTSIRNHRAFEEDLVGRLAHRRRHGTSLSLVMIDLDGLKELNDGEGHQAGDRAIKAVATALSETARAGDGVYRIGGDEFAALLPVASSWDAFNFAQRLHAALDTNETRVPVSVGVTESTEFSTRDGLIGEADIALMEAKTVGRDTVIFNPGMTRPVPDEADDDRRHQGTLAAALARAVDAKDSYTRSHSETVAELCALIATHLKLEPPHVAAIRLAGLVHDVGKIGVPDAILQKPAKLDEQEYEIIKSHSALGHKILHGTDLSQEAPWVLHHHERLDGRGYPVGLAGTDIPLESRIIHVADAFEAMTSDRPYRRGMPEEDAVAELRRHTGIQFDADCVHALLIGLGVEAPEELPRQPERMATGLF